MHHTGLSMIHLVHSRLLLTNRETQIGARCASVGSSSESSANSAAQSHRAAGVTDMFCPEPVAVYRGPLLAAESNGVTVSVKGTGWSVQQSLRRLESA